MDGGDLPQRGAEPAFDARGFVRDGAGSHVAVRPDQVELRLGAAREQLRQRVPKAIGLIRTGDTIQYANMVLVSGREG